MGGKGIADRGRVTYTSSQGSSSYVQQSTRFPAASLDIALFTSASGTLLAEVRTGGTVSVDLSTIGFTQQSITASGTFGDGPTLGYQTIFNSSVFNPAISGDITQNLLLSNVDLAANFSIIVGNDLSFIGSLNFGNFQVATPAATPLPAALPLFATGLGALGLFRWRRKQKAAAA
jgi:hypothetical protein